MADFKFSLADLENIHEERDVDLLWKTVKDLNNLAAGLKTDLKKGLSNEDIQNKFEDRRRAYGVNVMPQPPLRSFWELVFEGLQDSTLIMLMVSAVISLTLGIWENPEHGWIEGTAILIAVFLVVMVASGNDYQKERQFRKLNEKKENKQIQVIRAGDKTEASIYEINVGEIVSISTGDILCADGVLIEGSNLKCDNSTLTGESMDVKVNASNPLLFAGCQVSEGVGKMVVITVGPHSTAGRLMEKLQTRGGDTPLQEKLESLANDKIATIGLAAAGLILVCLTIKLIFKIYWYDLPVNWHIFSEIIKYFITSVTIVVVAVPEGLPLAVTIALAYSMLQMVKDQNLVRHLAACETMGGATTICSDKTGTLTKNLMTVTKGWVSDKIFEKVDDLSSFNISQETSIALHHGININCTAFLGKKNNEFFGNKTECALLGFSRKLGGKYDELQDSIEVVKKFPFSSKVKSMSTLVKTKDGYRMYSKGASEIMRLKCSHWIDGSGKILPIDEKFGKHIDDVIVQLASEGLRTILLAYRDFSESEFKEIDLEADEPPQDKYICISITGIKDPLRDEVKDAVKQCQDAGIVVRMVTGDNILTAKKIAEEAGILTGDGVAIEGPNFRKLSESEMDKIIPNLQVMARSSPTDKYVLVKRLKHLGQIVAVTGDGTNDAPALKEADVGFSMGIAGTEVAKEASDIILMDDNFSSIVKAVSWGRNVFDSIRKFLQFQLTVNVVAVSLAFIGAITSETGESPLKPVQLLWVNLIMDTMAALALATDVPTPELLQRKPYGKNANLITKSMWLNIIGQAAFQLVVNLLVLYLGHIFFGVEKDGIMHKTLIFNIFVLCQVVNEINCRKLGNDTRVFSGFFTNQICVAVLVFTLAVQWLIIEFGGEFASTTPLSFFQWIECIFIACLGFPVMFALRSVPISADDESESSESQEVKVSPKSEPTDDQESPSSSSLNRWKKVREQAVVQQVVSHMKKTTITESLRRRRKIDTPGFD